MGCSCCSNKDNCAYHHDEDCGHGHDHHGHNHEHNHGAGEEKDLKKRFIKICITLGLFIIVFVADKIFELASINPGPANWVLPFVCFFAVYLILGAGIVKEAFEGIIHGELLDENFLMAVASLGSFALGIYKGCIGMEPDGFEEGCAVIIFYCVGEWFQDWALNRSRKSIAELMNIRPDTAHILRDGNVADENPEHVVIGDTIIVRNGEKVPVDGRLISETAVINAMALTGESEYENPVSGCEILSGSINMGEEIQIQATKLYDDSAVARILDLVENATDKKAKTETFITRFARVYTPIVVGLAVLVALVMPIIGIITGLNQSVGEGFFADFTWTTWIYRALSFLVVSCPCALVISIPLSFFMGIGTASRFHILIKGSNCLELISKANVFVSDKTGTLTIGREIKPEAKTITEWLKKIGARLCILSGDKKEVVENVAAELGVSDYKYELLPQEKYDLVENMVKTKAKDEVVVYIGDGVNDAPALIRADVGVSMGMIGSDAAIEASNIVLMKDNLNGLPLLRKISERTMTIVWENIIFTIGIKVAVLVLSAFGITNMWVAVFADVGVALLAVLNALRVGLFKYNGKRSDKE